MAKTTSKNKSEKNNKIDYQEMARLSEELQSTSGKLLETTGTMHAFMQGLSSSGFRDYVDYMGKPWKIFGFN